MTSPTGGLIDHLNATAAADLDAPSEYALPGQLVQVTLADAAPFTVRVTNREYVAWDKTAIKHKWSPQNQPFLFASFLAFAGARREGLYVGTFDAFLEACEDVTELKAEATDPTNQGPDPS
jgi:hypothetical protein